MNINAINTTTNFRGLFTNKSSQNGGNWRMEYQPYSWESNNTGKMAIKEKIDFFANKLPDNEEIYYKDRGCCLEASDDILGTTSYYKAKDGTMRRTITEMPSMNREDSLRVVDKKLGKFIEMKQSIRKNIESNFGIKSRTINSYFDNYNIASYNYDNTFWNKKSMKESMDAAERGVKNSADDLCQDLQNYVKLMGSIDAVRQMKEDGEKEIKQLEDLRKSGLLIDISRRDVANPNEALHQALENVRSLGKKFICLPHKILSVEEIFSAVNVNTITDFINGENNKLINYVENLIKRTV